MAELRRLLGVLRGDRPESTAATAPQPGVRPARPTSSRRCEGHGTTLAFAVRGSVPATGRRDRRVGLSHRAGGPHQRDATCRCRPHPGSRSVLRHRCDLSSLVINECQRTAGSHHPPAGRWTRTDRDAARRVHLLGRRSWAPAPPPTAVSSSGVRLPTTPSRRPPVSGDPVNAIPIRVLVVDDQTGRAQRLRRGFWTPTPTSRWWVKPSDGLRGGGEIGQAVAPRTSS